MPRNSYFIVSKDLAADKTISATAKLLLAVLQDYRNKQTGQCNPHETRLATDLGVSRYTLMRRIAELKAAGLIDVKRTERGNRYEFPKSQNRTSEVAECNLAKSQNRTSGPLYPLYEPSLREPSAHAPKRAPRSLPKKPIQSEVVLERYYAMFGGVKK